MLRRAMAEPSLIKPRELARAMLGAEAPKNKVENKRSQIQHWMRGTRLIKETGAVVPDGISMANARALARALNQIRTERAENVRHPEDFLVQDRPPDRIARLEERVEELEKRLAEGEGA